MFEAIAFYLFAALTIVMFPITVMTSQALYAITAMADGIRITSYNVCYTKLLRTQYGHGEA